MKRGAYYNEFDPFAAEWLRALINFGHIAPGDVDERSILDVAPDDLKGYAQCHFFAGIGGWSLAARLAGWPDDRPLWTGSCPCQPFSVAGLNKGTKDERHLWPEFHRLIAECRPAIVAGEQVASTAGREWLAGVFADLEGVGYAVAGADLCAASVGAPHVRQRLWWVADALRERRRVGPARSEYAAHVTRAGEDVWRGVYVGCADGKARRLEPGLEPLAHGVPNRVGLLRGYGNAIVPQVAAEFLTAYLEATSNGGQ